MFRLLVENVHDYAIFVVDPNGRVQTWSKGAERLLCYREEEILGRPADLFFTPEDAAAGVPREEMRSALETGRGEDDRWHVRKDGSRFWSTGVTTPLRDEAGRLLGFAKIMRDHTELKRATDASRFQAHLLDVLGQAVIVTDAAGTITYWNRYAETLYGWTKTEAVGRSVMDLVVPAEAAGAGAAIMARLRTGEAWSGEFTVRRRDGTIFSALVTDVPVVEQGSLKAIIGLSVDITERKRVEEAVQQSEQRFRSLAEGMPHCVWLCDAKGQSVYQNRVWYDYTGMPIGSGHGEQWLEQYHPDDRAYLQEEWTSALQTDGAHVYDIEVRIRRHDGAYRWFRVKGAPIRDARGRTIWWVGTCTDIHEQRRLLDMLREADRLKDEFLAMLSHELRNPLAPIRNALHVMRQPGIDRRTLDRVRDMAERQVHHMARLLDDLLDVARISRGHIELEKRPVEVSTVIRSTVEAIAPLMEERRHALHVSVPAEPLWVYGDPTRLEQVLSNLLHNAAKYTNPGGEVFVSAEHRDADVVLCVRDTGIGIAADMLPKVFDLFVQAERRLDRSKGGVGIGLTLVKRLVEMHGGRVSVRSDGPGQGSEFVVRLPAAAASVVDDARPASGRGPSKRRRVLVVDDNPDAADSLGILLGLAGHDTRVAYDGRTALEAAGAFGPEVVLLDIGMPGMDGYEVARRLREQAGGVVIVALTGWGQDSDRMRSGSAGFDCHLVKPVEPAVVQDLLESLPLPQDP